MSITQQQLLQILSNAGQQACVFVPLLNTAMCRYQIVTLPRIAAFIAQVGHESAHLTQMAEDLKYSAQALRRSWPDRFDAELAAKVAYQPELIANIAYGQRMGNTEPGDGWRYRGRGLIQVTGKDNYRACGEDLGLNLVAFPELLEKMGTDLISQSVALIKSEPVPLFSWTDCMARRITFSAGTAIYTIRRSRCDHQNSLQ